MVRLPRLAMLSLVAGAACWAPVAVAQTTVEELDTPFVVTPGNVVTSMLDMAGLRAGDRLVDLGSGDGRIVIAAVQRGATAVGIEIDTALVEKSRETARRLKLGERATFVTQDLFETDFGGYDVITLYLLPDVNRRLAPRFLALRPGTRIVSHDYGLGDWPPDRTVVVDAPDKTVNVEKVSRVMFWRVPARIEGEWKGDVAGRPIVVNLAQRYQYVSGTLRLSARDHAIAEQKVDGDRIALRAGTQAAPLVMTLRAQGDMLTGEIREGEAPPVPLTLRR
jgi:SAM-dependent methyltransferase